MRRLLALVTGLPPDAAAFRPQDGWTFRDELAALTVEQLSALAGSPVTITHPGRGADKPKPTTDPAEISRFFARLSKGVNR